jgi:dTDP-glucose pyrophosphorylase/CBS domain-containing protein
MQSKKLKDFLISADVSIRHAIKLIDRNTRGIVLVVDQDRCLSGTVTDGDVRRAILGGINLDMAVRFLLKHRNNKKYPTPTTRPLGTPNAELLAVMNRNALRQIPLLDKHACVVDIVFLSDLVKEYELPIKAVVMAGGFGTRLRPLTKNVPKPMLPIGGKPLLERIIHQLQRSGIRHVNLSTFYKGRQIENHFKDGKGFGVGIKYVQENEPLGTAGALSLVDSKGPLLVINGDILTKVDFRSMLEFHNDHQADLTVGVRSYELKVPYGVVESNGVMITGISEKPTIQNFINAGIYLLSSRACKAIPKGKRCDMTDLIALLLRRRRNVISFPIREYWLDIGQMDDYQKAQDDFAKKP